MIPTPTAGDAKASGSRNTETSKAHPGVSLSDFVRDDGGRGRMYASPAARDHRSGKGRKDNGHTRQLPEQVGGALNPAWVEWLMQWPHGWTSLDPLPRENLCTWRGDPAAWTEPEDVPPTVAANTVPHRVDRLRCLGNGQVPVVASTAWGALA